SWHDGELREIDDSSSGRDRSAWVHLNDAVALDQQQRFSFQCSLLDVHPVTGANDEQTVLGVPDGVDQDYQAEGWRDDGAEHGNLASAVGDWRRIRVPAAEESRGVAGSVQGVEVSHGGRYLELPGNTVEC